MKTGEGKQAESAIPRTPTRPLQNRPATVWGSTSLVMPGGISGSGINCIRQLTAFVRLAGGMLSRHSIGDFESRDLI